MRGRSHKSPLLGNRDFMLLWSGQSISEMGSAVTSVVLPLTAVVVLRAPTLDVGLLSASTNAPFLLFALPAGLVVDRVAKRWLMLACNVARMVLIGSVPLAAAFGALTLAQLYAVALLTGVGTVFFDVSYQSYVPSLAGRDHLLDANGKLGATQSFAQVVGPGLGGVLFGVFRAGAMTADALSYVGSAASLLLIRAREPAPARGEPGEPTRAPRAPRAGRAGRALGTLRSEILAGAAFIVHDRVLRKVAACSATANLFGAAATAVQILFLVRVLHVHAAVTGLVLGAAGAGGVAGGLASARLGRWIGSARVISVSMLGFGSFALLMPLAEPGWRLALFPLGLAGVSFAEVTYNIAQLSYRQTVCPPELYGRVNAAQRWLVWSTLPLGGLLGGILGAAVGVRATIWIGWTGEWAAGWWVFFSPLRTMRDIPVPGGNTSEQAGRSSTSPPPA
jgi:MFS family permease